jgi:membrane fusion protein (multidrug efflux system)
VDSLSPASGSQFALLPPDNATGNFTKVVQRVPVKILFSEDDLRRYRERLAPGLSTIVKIRVPEGGAAP